VGEKTPWAHVDIAGVGNVDGASDLYVAGPTGWGVRLLTDWVETESR
jgi:leucyl aminopeptidase